MIPPVRESFVRRFSSWFLAALAGVCQAWALAWPFGVADSTAANWMSPPAWWAGVGAGQPVPWLQVVAMAVLVHLLVAAPTARSAGWRGWVFATAWLCATFWWLFVSMHTYGGLPAPLAVLAVVALAMFLASYYALASWSFRLFALDGIVFSAAVFSSLWMLAELARTVFFTGFPWGAVGYAHVDSLQWAAPWVGVYGMGWLAGLLSAAVGLASGRAIGLVWHNPANGVSAVARSAHRPTSNRLLVALDGVIVLSVLLLGCIAVFRPVTTRSTGVMPVVLLQGNIAQDEKFQASSGLPKALAWYAAGLGGQNEPPPKGALVVAPETALPLLPQQLGPEFWAPLLTELAQGQHAVLIGLPLGSTALGYSNAAWGITPSVARFALAGLLEHGQPARLDGTRLPGQEKSEKLADTASQEMIYRYEKHHLVPFGEFIPPAFKWFVALMNIPLGDFNRGALGQPALHWAGQRVATNICYEDLYGNELATGFASEGLAPTVMVNLSNIAWFGNTVAIDQHLHISRMRALELGRPMVRATNTGATVVIDHQGRVTHALTRHTEGALTGAVDGREGLTPFAQWASRWGLWPVFALAAAGSLSGLWVGMARRRRSP